MLFDAPPNWEAMSPEDQSEHYAQALREANAYGAVANDQEQHRIEEALRQHTPPLVAMRNAAI